MSDCTGSSQEARLSRYVAHFCLRAFQIWSTPPPGDSGAAALSIVWRSDGKLLSIGYSSGVISILDIESKDPVHRADAGSPVNCLSWIDCPGQDGQGRQEVSRVCPSQLMGGRGRTFGPRQTGKQFSIKIKTLRAGCDNGITFTTRRI